MHWVVLIFLFFLGTINFADKAVAGFSSIPIMKELALSYTDWGLVSSSFSWLYSIGGFVIAGWSDRIGTKKVLAIMAIAWTAAQLSSYAISGMFLLMFSRIWLGAFEGAYYACAISQMSKWFPQERRGFATSIINAGSTVGSFISAPLLVYIIQHQGWRHAFGFLGILSLAWVILWMIFGKEASKDKKLAIEKVPAKKLKWSEIAHIFKSPVFILTNLAYIGFFWFLSWTTSWMPAYLQKAVHLTPKEMGNASVIIGIVSLFVTIGICVYSDYLYKKSKSLRKSRVLVAGFSLILAGILFISTTFTQSATWAIIVLCLGKGLAFTISPLGAQIMVSLFPERKGLLVGLMVAFGNLAGIVGPWVTGLLIDANPQNVVQGFNYSILCFAFILLVFGAIFAYSVQPDKRKINAEEAVEGVSLN